MEENAKAAVIWKREKDGKARKARGRESKLNIAGRILDPGEVSAQATPHWSACRPRI
jgi:hypothetical protein